MINAVERARLALREFGILTLLHDYDWVTAYEAGAENTEQWINRTNKWLVGLPPDIQKLVRRFPPGCLVVANRSLQHPAMGSIGIVVGYHENDVVTVQSHPGKTGAGQALAGWFKVVGFRGSCNFEHVISLLGKET